MDKPFDLATVSNTINDSIANVLIVGSGRAAEHLKFYFSQKKLPVFGWSRRDLSNFNSAPLNLPPHVRLKQVLEHCQTVILAISDDRIEDFIQTYSSLLKDHDIFHLSGSIVSDKAVGVHPLMSFAGEPYKLSVYEKMPLLADSEKALEHALWSGLPNPKYLIRAHDKALYHTFCALAANVPSLLWQKSLSLLERRLQLPAEMFSPILHQTVENVLRDRARALTGPVARRDFKTLERHLEILEGTELHALYQDYIAAGLA